MTTELLNSELKKIKIKPNEIQLDDQIFGGLDCFKKIDHEFNNYTQQIDQKLNFAALILGSKLGQRKLDVGQNGSNQGRRGIILGGSSSTMRISTQQPQYMEIVSKQNKDGQFTEQKSMQSARLQISSAHSSGLGSSQFKSTAFNSVLGTPKPSSHQISNNQKIFIKRPETAMSTTSRNKNQKSNPLLLINSKSAQANKAGSENLKILSQDLSLKLEKLNDEKQNKSFSTSSLSSNSDSEIQKKQKKQNEALKNQKKQAQIQKENGPNKSQNKDRVITNFKIQSRTTFNSPEVTAAKIQKKPNSPRNYRQSMANISNQKGNSTHRSSQNATEAELIENYPLTDQFSEIIQKIVNNTEDFSYVDLKFICSEMGIDISQLTTIQNVEEKEQYVIDCMQNTVRIGLDGWFKKRLSKIQEIQIKQKKLRDQKLQKAQSESPFDWVDVNSKFLSIDQKFKEQLIVNLNEYENLKPVEEFLTEREKTNQEDRKNNLIIKLNQNQFRSTPILKEMINPMTISKNQQPSKNQASSQSINQIEASNKIEDKQSTSEGINRIEIGKKLQRLQQNEDDIDDIDTQLGLKNVSIYWDDDKEQLFRNYRSDARSRLISNIKSSSFNNIGMTPLSQQINPNAGNNEQRQSILDKYAEGELITSTEAKFIANTSNLLNLNMDQIYTQNAISSLDKQQKDDIELMIAQEIICKYERIVGLLKKSRNDWMNEKIKADRQQIEKANISQRRVDIEFINRKKVAQVSRIKFRFIKNLITLFEQKVREAQLKSSEKNLFVGYFIKQLKRKQQETQIENMAQMEEDEIKRQFMKKKQKIKFNNRNLPKKPLQTTFPLQGENIELDQFKRLFHPPSKLIVHDKQALNFNIEENQLFTAEEKNIQKLAAEKDDDDDDPVNTNTQKNQIKSKDSENETVANYQTKLIKELKQKQDQFEAWDKNISAYQLPLHKKQEYAKQDNFQTYYSNGPLKPRQYQFEQFVDPLAEMKRYEPVSVLAQEHSKWITPDIEYVAAKLIQSNYRQYIRRKQMKIQIERLKEQQIEEAKKKVEEYKTHNNLDQIDMDNLGKEKFQKIIQLAKRVQNQTPSSVSESVNMFSKGPQLLSPRTIASDLSTSRINTIVSRGQELPGMVLQEGRSKKYGVKFFTSRNQLDPKKQQTHQPSGFQTQKQKKNLNKKLQMQKQSDLNLKNQQLIEAAQKGSLQLILQSGFIFYPEDLNCVDEKGNTPLYYAVKNYNEPFVNWLLQQKADINLNCQNGNTVLHLAFQNQSEQTVMKFIMAGADLNELNFDGMTPVAFGNTELLRKLNLIDAVAICKDPTQKFDNNKFFQSRNQTRIYVPPEQEMPETQINFEYDILYSCQSDVRITDRFFSIPGVQSYQPHSQRLKAFEKKNKIFKQKVDDGLVPQNQIAEIESELRNLKNYV